MRADKDSSSHNRGPPPSRPRSPGRPTPSRVRPSACSRWTSVVQRAASGQEVGSPHPASAVFVPEAPSAMGSDRAVLPPARPAVLKVPTQPSGRALLHARPLAAFVAFYAIMVVAAVVLKTALPGGSTELHPPLKAPQAVAEVTGRAPWHHAEQSLRVRGPRRGGSRQRG